MKSISTSTYTFSDLIQGGFLYVDKTDQIYSLFCKNKGQFFLSRPRRFGKSLLISTLKSIFLGQRDLFNGLAIDSLDYDWKPYPVIHLDMGSTQASSPEQLSEKLIIRLQSIAEESGVVLPSLSSLADASEYFYKLVELLAKQSPEGKVVILIDEYDKPILNHIGTPDVIAFRNVLKKFYSVVKTTEGLQRFALLTGVSKFSKVSIFSDLNNLTDLTMDARAATLLGYTQEEVETYFADRLPDLAHAIEKSELETLAQLKQWYDGFRFSKKQAYVYNPISVGNCFLTLDFKNYWFETATPTFLLELLKKEPLDIHHLSVPEDAFSVYEVENLDPLPLLVQTGYLTIKDCTERAGIRRYKLGYPNFEVKQSFNRWLLDAFSKTPKKDQLSILDQITDALIAGNLEPVFFLLPVFFARIPNKITLKNEKYYQTIFYTIFDLIGTEIHAEVDTNIGRIDATIETDRFIYLFEFKLHDTAASAIAQIHEKKYDQRYLASGKQIFLIGVAFDKSTRNLGEHIVESL